MALDFGTVGDLFERDIGDGDVEANAGNRRINRGIKGQTEWQSPAEINKVVTSGAETVKTATLNMSTSKNIFLGVAVSLDAKSTSALGSWRGTIKITGVNNDTVSTYKSQGGVTDGFIINESSSYINQKYYLLTPDEDAGSFPTVKTAMNDTRYTIELQLESNGTVNTMYIKNLVVNLYYIEFDDVADEVIIS
jgi:hypothetical protein